MATTVTKTVKSSGGDYSSLSAWEAGVQGDLVTADQVQQAECYPMQDTSVIVIDGSTTDASRYLRMYPVAGGEAGMPWRASTDAYQFSPAGAVGVNYAFQVFDPFCRIENLQIEYRDSTIGDGQTIVYVLSGNSRFSGCYFRHDAPNGGGYGRIGILADGGGAFVNCVFTTCRTASGQPPAILANGTLYAYNCTFYDCGYGINHNTGTTFAKNCLTANCTQGFNGTFDASSDYNATSDATAPPGAHSRTSQTFTFVNAAGGDFHLSSSDAGARDFGADLSADANYAFNTDFDGATRTVPWDIGAHEYIASGTASLGGTALSAMTEADVVVGGKTITITLSGITWLGN